MEGNDILGELDPEIDGRLVAEVDSDPESLFPYSHLFADASNEDWLLASDEFYQDQRYEDGITLLLSYLEDPQYENQDFFLLLRLVQFAAHWCVPLVSFPFK